MKTDRLLISFFVLLILASLSSAWTNPPPRAIDYRGFVFINGMPAPDGTVLEMISDASNTGGLVMDQKILQYGNGYFNNLQMIWDDPSTAADEGITYDMVTLEHIMFRVNGHFSYSPEYLTVKSSDEGTTFDVMLNFSTAAAEVPVVPANITPHPSPHPIAVPVTERCDERWECSGWQPEKCPPTCRQARKCADKNGCGTQERKPSEEQECIYLPPPAAKPKLIEMPYIGKFIPALPWYAIILIIALALAVIVIFMLWLARRLLRSRKGKR